MIKIYTTKTFDKLFKKLPSNIQRKAVLKTKIFRRNPFLPTLRTEKLTPKRYNVYSFRIDLDYRIVFTFLNAETIEFRFIGHHNKIYDYDIFK